MTLAFSDTWDMLVGRLSGRMTFRFVIQPLMASIFAVRSGLKDSRQGHPAYLWSIYSNPESRHELLHHGWKDVRNVFILAILLDAVYQIIEFRWVYVVQAVFVAIALAIVPYVLVRGPFSRLVSMNRRSDDSAPHPHHDEAA